MTLRTVVIAPSVTSEVAASFRSTARLIFSAYAANRVLMGIPASKVTAILADDFAGEVDRYIPFGGPFYAERVGGSQAVAKNLDQTGDCSEVVIVFDAFHWRITDDPAQKIFLVTIIAHELAHPILNRAAYASGAMDGVVLPSVTPHEGVRSGSRIMADEYRADRLAEIVAGTLASIRVDGEPKPYRTWPVRGQIYVDALVRILTDAHPAWPDTVDRYRNWEIPIEEMWASLVQAIDQTLTLLVHAQAFADAAETDLTLLAIPEIAQLPAVRLYLAEPMAEFMDLIRSAPILASLRGTRALEDELARVGANAHLEVYRRLGLRPRDLPRPMVHIDVGEPIR